MANVSLAHPAGLTGAIGLRPAGLGDEAFLREVYAGTRAEELVLVDWDGAQRAAFLNMQFQIQRQCYRAQYPAADHRVISLDGRPIGRVIVARSTEEIRLVDISLLPGERNLGVGTAVIEGILDEAGRAGRPVRLQVLSSNRALGLYRRLGFAEAGRSGAHLLLEWRQDAGSRTAPTGRGGGCDLIRMKGDEHAGEAD